MAKIDHAPEYTREELLTFIDQTCKFDKTALFGALFFFGIAFIPVGFSIWLVATLISNSEYRLLVTVGVVGCLIIGVISYWGMLLIQRVELLHMQQVGIGQRVVDVQKST